MISVHQVTRSRGLVLGPGPAVTGHALDPGPGWRGRGVPRRRQEDDGCRSGGRVEQHVCGMYEQMARIVITPQWVRYYDFGARRMLSFLQELAERNRS